MSVSATIPVERILRVMPPKKKRIRSIGSSIGELSDSSVNGLNVAPKGSVATDKVNGAVTEMMANKKVLLSEPPKKQSSKKVAQSNSTLSSSKQKRKGSTTIDVAAMPSQKQKKRKEKSQKGSKCPSRNFADTYDNSSVEDAGDGSIKDYPQFPAVDDIIAIKCPAEPPHPPGWYSAVVIDIIVHDQEKSKDSNKNMNGKGKRDKKRINFTLQVEWDGGGVEEIKNPEWRMKGDEPDKHGRISHRDAKLRPYFRYWVNRLNSMNESEQKLHHARPGKSIRPDPNQKVEWIQCASPNCGKWRPLPLYLKSSSVLKTCNNAWYCVLNSWDEATASCGAPQETGYMPNKL